MDPRQPSQHPFPRNAASPYNRSPFPPAPPAPTSTSQSPYPPSGSHPPPPSAAYPEQRRSAENPFHPSAARPYAPDSSSAPHQPPSGHARHHSASSLPPASSNRAMLPPGSPPQPGSGLPQQSGPPPPHQMGHYLPAPRGPVGPSTPFGGGRELPALSQIQRTGSTGSSMSISSMLGGPSASRDSQPPPSQYGPPPPATSAPSGSSYGAPVHASPRMHSASNEYPSFRRPQTPEHPRPYDPRADPRASVAASPQNAYSSTPEMQRYGTPQGYHQRAPSQQDNRESGRISGGPPPRPSSQPKAFSGMPPRPMDGARGAGPEDPYPQRRDEPPRSTMEYNPERTGLKPFGYDDRYRVERERREEMEFRERDRRERAYSGGEASRGGFPPHPAEYRQEPGRGQPPPFSRPPELRDTRDPRDLRDPRDPRDGRDVREPPSWQRPGFEQPRAPYDPAGFYPRHHEQPPSTGPPYPPHPATAYAQAHDRYPPVSHPAAPPLPPPSQNQPYESPDRGRLDTLHPRGAPHGHRRSMEEGPPPPSVAYNPAALYDSPRNRLGEDHQAQSNRGNMLAVQEINRKGRISPLPQAVQGAQPQLTGPAGEPGIKSEFGRMFSGIGSGVSGIVSSPVASGAQLPHYSGQGLGRRDDTDSAAQDSGPDVPGKPTAKGRRRKLKDVESKTEDDNGRATPVGRTKRLKGQHQHQPGHHHHHHQYVPDDETMPRGPPHGSVASLVQQANPQYSHHHHAPHHHHPDEAAANATSAGIAALKNLKGGAPLQSPTFMPRDHVVGHGHSLPRATPQIHPGKDVQVKTPLASPVVVIPPKIKTQVSSKEVLKSVADKPRNHLGDVIYEPYLQPARQLQKYSPDTGFASTPKPLPIGLITGKENSTLTVKVPRVHLTPIAREEITRRRALWGTDVYTDDSDIVAACIHGGWIRGEWPDSVDTNLLELDKSLAMQEKDLPASKRRKDKEREEQARNEANAAVYHDKPPKTGPVHMYPDRDLHVTVLILPRLERYGSTTRFGIQSREFGGLYGGRRSIHDGISYMVMAIRWVDNGAGPQSRLRGKGRRERMRKAMAEVKGINWPEETDQGTVVHVPGEPLSWRKHDTNGAPPEHVNGDKAASEGDKENRPAEPVDTEMGQPDQHAEKPDAEEGVAASQSEQTQADKES